MRVVFDQELLAGNYPATTVSYFLNLIRQMAELSPDDEFILLTVPNKKLRESFPDNVFVSVSKHLSTRLLGSKFLQKFRLPRDVKRLAPDLFVGFDNTSLYRYEIKKVLFCVDTAPTDPVMNRSVASAKAVFKIGAGGGEAVQSLPIPLPLAEQRLSWGLKENLKVQYTAGYDYFLFAGDIDNRYDLISLLKAFSIFKQWQQSGMRLVIAGRDTKHTSAFEAQLDTYKYRGEVILFKNPPPSDLADLMSGAYAFVYPALKESFPVTVLQAMAHGVAVITTDLPVLREWTGNAASFVSGDLVSGMAKMLQQVYKDEQARDEIVLAQDRLLPQERADYATQFMAMLRTASQQK